MQELARSCGLALSLSQSVWYWRGLSSAMTSSRAMSQAGRSYEDTIAALNSLQSNAAYINSIKGQPLATQAERFLFVARCAEMIGLGPKELSNLSVIHVAGTKGKGTTSAYCESILRHNGYRTGFFSSPHLVSVRERIRISGQPISTQKFTSYFWSVYNTLQENKDPEMRMPPYFAFLTLMAFRVFQEEEVDVAIVEVGIGGERDSTNILQNVSVVGITSLGIDHTAVLGNTISSIAWQKGGIFKPSAIGYTVPGHPPEALQVLVERSLERKCPVEIAPPLDQYTWPDSQSRQAALSLFRTQKLNASLALQLTHAWMQRNCQSNPECKQQISVSSFKEASPFLVSRKTTEGLLKCQWPGRNQILDSDCGQIKYFLDGAHTLESMEACVEWYLRNRPSSPGVKHALLLNMTGERDRSLVIEPLFACAFHKIIFSPNIAHSSSSQGDLLNLRISQSDKLNQTEALHDLWKSLTERENQQCKRYDGARPISSELHVANCVNEALKEFQNVDVKWSVLVTGSLHLVGAVLSLIDPTLEKSEKLIRGSCS